MKIDQVVSPPWLPRSSPRAVAAFRAQVYGASPEYYQTPAAAQSEIRARQTKCFARAFDYDWFQTALPPGTVELLPPLAPAPVCAAALPDVTPPPDEALPAAAAAAAQPSGWKFTR